VQLKGLILNHNRVSSVDPTLVAHDHIRRLAEQISNLSFPFIAPLGPNHNYVSQWFSQTGTVFNDLSLWLGDETPVNRIVMTHR
jgi:hypothetical protein